MMGNEYIKTRLLLTSQSVNMCPISQSFDVIDNTNDNEPFSFVTRVGLILAVQASFMSLIAVAGLLLEILVSFKDITLHEMKISIIYIVLRDFKPFWIQNE